MNEGLPSLKLLESVASEWMRMANLCAKVVDLAEQGFTIDSCTLQEIRDAINEPRFAHFLENAVAD